MIPSLLSRSLISGSSTFRFGRQARLLLNPATTTTTRLLHLHEHQSISLLRRAGLQTQNGNVATTPIEARQVAEQLLDAAPGCDLIVKAQIHAGGRGKGYFDNGLKGKTPKDKKIMAKKETPLLNI
jgi:hypothetical protein